MDLPSDAHNFRNTLFIPGLCRSQLVHAPNQNLRTRNACHSAGPRDRPEIERRFDYRSRRLRM
jgi:hypothetical protein